MLHVLNRSFDILNALFLVESRLNKLGVRFAANLVIQFALWVSLWFQALAIAREAVMQLSISTIAWRDVVAVDCRGAKDNNLSALPTITVLRIIKTR